MEQISRPDFTWVIIIAAGGGELIGATELAVSGLLYVIMASIGGDRGSALSTIRLAAATFAATKVPVTDCLLLYTSTRACHANPPINICFAEGGLLIGRKGGKRNLVSMRIEIHIIVKSMVRVKFYNKLEVLVSMIVVIMFPSECFSCF